MAYKDFMLIMERIMRTLVEVSVDTGIADDTSTVNYLDDASKSWPPSPGGFENLIIEITEGTGIDQFAKIASNTATRITFVSAMPVAPDSTSKYRIGFFGKIAAVTQTAAMAGQVPVGVNVTTASTQILAANASRKCAIICNDSDTTMWLAIGQTAVINRGPRLNANGGVLVISINGDIFSTEAVNAIHASSGNKVATAQELQ